MFHGRRHPRELGGAEVSRFLTWLAVERRVSASELLGHKDVATPTIYPQVLNRRPAGACAVRWTERSNDDAVETLLVDLRVTQTGRAV